MEGETVVALQGMALVFLAMALLSIAAKILQKIFRVGVDVPEKIEEIPAKAPAEEKVEVPSAPKGVAEEPVGEGVEEEVVVAITSALHLHEMEAYAHQVPALTAGREHGSPWAIAGRIRLLNREPRR